MTIIDRIVEETAHRWEAAIVTADGNSFALNNWLPVTITDNFDGLTMELTTADLDQAARIQPLTTDIVLLRDDVVFERLRVLDDTDTFTADGHTVTFVCASYDAILDRRILHVDWDGKTGDQHALARELISHTEGQDRLNLDKTQTIVPAALPNAGQQRTRTIKKGLTIAAALDDLAEAINGFDWWFSTDADGSVRFNAQTPRRTNDLTVMGGLRELGWGQGFQSIKADGSSEDYASRIMTTGAQQETSIPGSTGGPAGNGIYPPPPAQTVRMPTMPYGLWEKAVAYSDVLTVASLRDKAEWNLREASSLRKSYQAEFEPGVWNPSIRPGTRFTLNISSPPRTVLHETVRIEELSIALAPDGSELVTAVLRAEEPPSAPTAVAPLVAALPGETTATGTTPTGRSIQKRRVGGEAELGRILTSLRDRVIRTERSGWNG